MTGPEHYREGERLLAGKPITDEERERGIEGDRWPPSQMELLVAQTHFLASLVAILAGAKASGSVAWQEAVRPGQGSTA